MRLRDTLKFSLELFLPEKLIQAAGRLAPASTHEPSPAPRSLNVEQEFARARLIIEELDHAHFGGPSFGPQTIALMSTALNEAQASLQAPVSEEQIRKIAAAILKVAADGERDPARLRFAAISMLGLEDTPPT